MGFKSSSLPKIGNALTIAPYGKIDPPKNHSGKTNLTHTREEYGEPSFTLAKNIAPNPQKKFTKKNASKNLGSEKWLRSNRDIKINFASGKIILESKSAFRVIAQARRKNTSHAATGSAKSYAATFVCSKSLINEEEE